MTKVNDITNCSVCGHEAKRDLDTDTNEMSLSCDRCGFYAETEIVKDSTGKTFWLETKRLPMDEGGRVIRGTCVAQVSEARWWLPRLQKTVNSIEQPTADAEFIKNVAYRQCGKAGVQWDEHANIRSEEESGWTRIVNDHIQRAKYIDRRHYRVCCCCFVGHIHCEELDLISISFRQISQRLNVPSCRQHFIARSEARFNNCMTQTTRAAGD
jgi:hypothetical protein